MTRLLPAASRVALAPASLDEDAPAPLPLPLRALRADRGARRGSRDGRSDLPVPPRSRRRRGAPTASRGDRRPRAPATQARGQPQPPLQHPGGRGEVAARWALQPAGCRHAPAPTSGRRHRLASAAPAGGGRRCSTLVVALRPQPPSSPRRAEQDTSAQVAPPSFFAVRHLPLQAQQGRDGPICSPRESTAASLATEVGIALDPRETK